MILLLLITLHLNELRRSKNRNLERLARKRIRALIVMIVCICVLVKNMKTKIQNEFKTVRITFWIY